MEFPLLGEPLPVELANTRYGQGEDAFDFLLDQEHARAWLAELQLQVQRTVPSYLLPLRDAVHGLLSAVADGRAPSRHDVTIVNRAARHARALSQLSWNGSFSKTTVTMGGCNAALLRTLADETIALLSGPSGCRVRRCAADDCTMLFVQQHKRRRYCHPTCSGRMRQAAYTKRQQSHD